MTKRDASTATSPKATQKQLVEKILQIQAHAVGLSLATQACLHDPQDADFWAFSEICRHIADALGGVASEIQN